MKVAIIDHTNLSLSMKVTAGVMSESIYKRALLTLTAAATQAISGQCFEIDYLLKDAWFHYSKAGSCLALAKSL